MYTAFTVSCDIVSFVVRKVKISLPDIYRLVFYLKISSVAQLRTLKRRVRKVGVRFRLRNLLSQYRRCVRRNSYFSIRLSLEWEMSKYPNPGRVELICESVAKEDRRMCFKFEDPFK